MKQLTRSSITSFMFLLMRRIFYGNAIPRTIAAVRRLIDARNLLFYSDVEQTATVIDRLDLTGISVFDVMMSPEYKEYYGENSQDFRRVVEKILNNNAFEFDIKTVKTYNDNTTLRLKHFNVDYSDDYKDAVVTDNNPLVLAHGLNSNLNTWDDFGKKLAQNGFDTWIIEMYGGPTTECVGCQNYTFANLTEFYWPALITGVQNYSGQDTLSYVGFDLGCTVALESLEDYNSGKSDAAWVFNTETGEYELDSLSATPIETFVALGCLGNFTQAYYDLDYYLAPFPDVFSRLYPNINSSLDTAGLVDGHINGEIIRAQLLLSPGIFIDDFTHLFYMHMPPGDKDALISKEIYEELFSWMSGDVQEVGKDVSITNFAMIQSTYDNHFLVGAPTPCFDFITCIVLPNLLPMERINTDKIVSDEDQKEICINVNPTNLNYVGFTNIQHYPSFIFGGLPDNDQVHIVITEYLKNKKIDYKEGLDIISTNPSTCT